MKWTLNTAKTLIFLAIALGMTPAFASIHLTCVSLDSSKELLVEIDLAQARAIRAQVTDHDTGLTKADNYKSNGHSLDSDGLFTKGRYLASSIKCQPEIILRAEGNHYTGTFYASSLAQTSGCPFSGQSVPFHCR